MAIITTEWAGKEYFPITELDHLEFYVGNAKQAVHYYRSVFGMEAYAYAGPETGQMDRVSYVLKQNKIFLFLPRLFHQIIPHLIGLKNMEMAFGMWHLK